MQDGRKTKKAMFQVHLVIIDCGDAYYIQQSVLFGQREACVSFSGEKESCLTELFA